MVDYQERVVKEKADLDAKIKKLNAYLLKMEKEVEIQTQASSASVTLTSEGQRLYHQLGIMQEYSNCLNERINCFE